MTSWLGSANSDVTPAIPGNRSRPAMSRAVALTGQRGKETQAFGTVARLPIALDGSVCADSVKDLNQILADTMTLRDLYKKHHWQVAGETFYQLHLLFDKHDEATKSRSSSSMTSPSASSCSGA